MIRRKWEVVFRSITLGERNAIERGPRYFWFKRSAEKYAKMCNRFVALGIVEFYATERQ